MSLCCRLTLLKNLKTFIISFEVERATQSDSIDGPTVFFIYVSLQYIASKILAFNICMRYIAYKEMNK